MGKRTKKGIPFSRFFDYSTEKALCKLTKEDGAVILRPCRRAPERVLRGFRFFLRVWRNGRRARFRFWWETVQVQVLLPAVEQEKSGRQDLNLFKLLLPAVEQETERRIRREVFGFYGRFRE